MSETTAVKPHAATPDHGTLLSMDRTSMAAERTLMAWIRTSISMISFGFTLAKFFEYLAHQKAAAVKGPLGGTWAASTVGLTLVAIGTFSLIAAIIQHRSELSTLHAAGLPTRLSLALIVASTLAVLGAFALLALILNWA